MLLHRGKWLWLCLSLVEQHRCHSVKVVYKHIWVGCQWWICLMDMKFLPAKVCTIYLHHYQYATPLLMSCWLHTLLLLFSRDAKKCQGVLAALTTLQIRCLYSLDWTGCKLYPLRPTLGQILLPTGLSESKSVLLWLTGSANTGSHGFHQHPRAWRIHLCTFLYLWGSHWARWVMWGVLSVTKYGVNLLECVGLWWRAVSIEAANE